MHWRRTGICRDIEKLPAIVSVETVNEFHGVINFVTYEQVFNGLHNYFEGSNVNQDHKEQYHTTVYRGILPARNRIEEQV